jgi:hypothetical protein
MLLSAMSNLYRVPSIDASYRFSVLFAKRFQRRIFFRNQPIRNKNFLWRPCLLMDRDEMSNLNRGPSMDAVYQISDQLTLRFQRRRFKCEKLTDDRRRTPSDGKSSHCLWQGELEMEIYGRTCLIMVWHYYCNWCTFIKYWLKSSVFVFELLSAYWNPHPCLTCNYLSVKIENIRIFCNRIIYLFGLYVYMLISWYLIF